MQSEMGWKDTSSRDAEGAFLTLESSYPSEFFYASEQPPLTKPISRLPFCRQRLGPVARDEEVCWQILRRGRTL